jgi:hypothetical protein
VRGPGKRLGEAVRAASSNEALQQTGGEGGSRRCGSPFGEPLERSRRVVRRPQLNAGVSPQKTMSGDR